MKSSDKPTDMNEIEHELQGVEDELQDFEEKQVNVTRTLQMIVYPAMVAFIILSAYGFYLVQSLTTDVHRLTGIIAKMNNSVDRNMGDISTTMGDMNKQMGNLVLSIDMMSSNIVGMNQNIQSMTGNIRQMDASTQNMAVSTYNMQRDLWSMNKNISGPMKMFNKFNPFGSDKTTPYIVPPPMVGTPSAYYVWPQQQVVQQQLPNASAQHSNAPAMSNTQSTQSIPTQLPAAVEAEDVVPVSTPTDAATAQDGHSFIVPENQGMIVIANSTRG